MDSATTAEVQAGSSGDDDVSLSTLLVKTLSTAAGLLEAPDVSQTLLSTTLANLSLCWSLIQHLSLLPADPTANSERVDELPTPSLRCFLVPYYTASLELQRRTKDYNGRKDVLRTASSELQKFRKLVEGYEVIDDERRRQLFVGSSRGNSGSILSNGGIASSDAAARRDEKIRQFKEERALKAQIEQLNARLLERPTNSVSSGSVNAADPSSFEDEYLRPLLLAQISHSYLRTISELDSISHELQLLENAPNMSELPSPRTRHRQLALGADDGRAKQREQEDQTWRLDAPLGSTRSQSHELIDESGRVLRPFTILPSASSSGSALDNTRLRFQSTVFGSSHRLPTMSIDEYLQMEQERGNILQGGGARNAEESRQEASDKKAFEEEEDNAEGYEREERGLAKKREWDDYRDEHRRGEGNRINQG